MSCCSSRRPPLSAGIQRPALPLHAAPGALGAPVGRSVVQVVFELRDGPGLTVPGRDGVRHYRFSRVGDRLVVDPRDAARLDREPRLRRL